MPRKRFKSSDAWIFLSIPSTKGIHLENIIGTADYINHAIPTDKEIEGAVNRLSAAGLILFKGDTFKLTASGKRLYHRVAPYGSSLLKAWKELESYLNSTELPVVKISRFKLKPDQFKTAYQKYSNNF